MMSMARILGSTVIICRPSCSIGARSSFSRKSVMIASLTSCGRAEGLRDRFLLPSLNQIGFLFLERVAQLFDATFSLRGRQCLRLEHKRGGAAEVERGQGFEQMFARHDAIMVGKGRVINHADPEFIGDSKLLWRHSFEREQSRERFFSKHLSPDGL